MGAGTTSPEQSQAADNPNNAADQAENLDNVSFDLADALPDADLNTLSKNAARLYVNEATGEQNVLMIHGTKVHKWSVASDQVPDCLKGLTPEEVLEEVADAPQMDDAAFELVTKTVKHLEEAKQFETMKTAPVAEARTVREPSKIMDKTVKLAHVEAITREQPPEVIKQKTAHPDDAIDQQRAALEAQFLLNLDVPDVLEKPGPKPLSTIKEVVHAAEKPEAIQPDLSALFPVPALPEQKHIMITPVEVASPRTEEPFTEAVILPPAIAPKPVEVTPLAGIILPEVYPLTEVPPLIEAPIIFEKRPEPEQLEQLVLPAPVEAEPSQVMELPETTLLVQPETKEVDWLNSSINLDQELLEILDSEAPVAEMTDFLEHDMAIMYDRIAHIEDGATIEQSGETYEIEAAITEAPLLTALMPTELQDQLVTYETAAEPEQAIAFKSKIFALEVAAIELEELFLDGEASELDIADAEQILTVLYEELLEQIGYADPEQRQELTQAFIVHLREQAGLVRHVQQAATRLVRDDEATHERKRTFTDVVTQSLSDVRARLHRSIGQLLLVNA